MIYLSYYLDLMKIANDKRNFQVLQISNLILIGSKHVVIKQFRNLKILL